MDQVTLEEENNVERTQTNKASVKSDNSSKNNKYGERSFVSKFLRFERILQFSSSLIPDDSGLSHVMSYVYGICCLYFTIAFSFPHFQEFFFIFFCISFLTLLTINCFIFSATGTISRIARDILLKAPFQFGITVFLKDEASRLLACQIAYLFLILLQVSLIVSTIIGLNSLPMMKDPNFKKGFKLLLLAIYIFTPSNFLMIGEFARCNFFQVYSSSIQDLNSISFPSMSCLDSQLLIFDILGCFSVLFQIIIQCFATIAFVPLNQTHPFAFFSTSAICITQILQCFQFLTMIFLPPQFVVFGYLLSAIFCSSAIACLWFADAFHSIFQAGSVIAFVSFRGCWSLLLLVFEIVAKIPWSNVVGEESWVFLKELIGVFAYFATILTALFFGTILGACFALNTWRIVRKLKSAMRNHKSNSTDEITSVANMKKSELLAKKYSGIMRFIPNFFSSELSNREFMIGVQMSANDSNFETAIFEEMVCFQQFFLEFSNISCFYCSSADGRQNL